MAAPPDRRLILTVGGGAVVLALAVGAAVYAVRHDRPKGPPPASVGGLVVQMGHAEDARLDPKKPLRCFVNGQFVGLETLSDCARKNGVATEALDVGVDQNGALAAQQGAGLTPLPVTASAAAAPAGAAVQAASPARAVGECWRYAGGTWRKAGDGMALNACVQTLFAGHCEKPGGASYGRWMGQTIRLVPHRVEISADNKTFRPVVEQSDSGCAIPEF